MKKIRKSEIYFADRLTVGDYTISRITGMGDVLEGSYWIGKEDGEGMGVSAEKFGKLIHTFFKAEL